MKNVEPYLYALQIMRPVQEISDASIADGVVTILSLSTEKMDMHTRHEEDLSRWLSQLSAESSKQTQVTENAFFELISTPFYHIRGYSIAKLSFV